MQAKLPIQPPEQLAQAISQPEKFNFKKYTTIGVIGQKGAGKTRFAIMCMAAWNIPSVFIDPIGAVRKYRAQGMAPTGTYISLMGVPSSSQLRATLQKKGIYIFDTSKLIGRANISFMDTLCRVLLEIGGYALFVDEVGDYAPQGMGRASWELERTVRVGRNMGIMPQMIMTQRPQRVDKNLLALCDCFIFFRVVYTLDRQKIQGILDLADNEFEYISNQLMTLPNGSALVFEPDKYMGRNISEALTRLRCFDG